MLQKKETMMKYKNLARVIAFFLSFSIFYTATATELGLTNYPVGVNGILDGLLPPPGVTQVLNYNLYERSTKYLDDDGDSAIPDFENTTIVSAWRTIHTWNYVAGKYTFSSVFNVPFIRADTSIMGSSDTHTGVGVIDLEPLHINYKNSSNTFFSSLFFDVFIKTGDYDPNRLANSHQNYNSIAPLYSYTWIINENWSTSGTYGFEFPLERNSETEYKSGDTFLAHPSVEYTPSGNRQLHFGLFVYHLRQLNDDEQFGVKVRGGGRTRTTGIGGSIRYDFNRQVSAALKYNDEVGTRNRAEQDPLWLQFSFLF